MRSHGIAAAIALTFVLAPQATSAQSYRWDFGVSAGVGMWSAPNETDVKLASRWNVSAQLSEWISNGVGVRANLSYADRPLLSPNGPALLRHVNVWQASGDLMLRFHRPNAAGLRMVEVLPYLALGAGARWTNPGRSEGTFTYNDVTYRMDDGPRLMGLAGLGIDVRISRLWALRFEAGNRFSSSSLVTGAEEPVGGLVHELYAQLGLQRLLGVQRAADHRATQDGH
jgi:hypothetical protein